MNSKKQHSGRFFYVAKLQCETHDPMGYLLSHPATSRGGTLDSESLKALFAKATGDVYVPVKADGRDAGVVFVAPTIAGKPWRVFFTIEPMKQGEIYGDDGPLADHDEALRAAKRMSKGGGEFAVFEFTPRAEMAPVVQH